MSTLRDLRDTLDEHADRLDDPDRYARVAAVRARVRVVRRRRAAATAVAAAVAVVATVTAVGSLRSPGEVEPAGPSVIGIDLPEELTYQGFPYALDETRALTPGQRTSFGPEDEERLLALTARDLGEGAATLYVGDDAVARLLGDDDHVGVPVLVSGGSEVRVRLDDAADGARVGVASYDATGELAEGVDNGRAVFRSTVGTATLVHAAFGDDAVETTFTGSLAETRFARYCRAGRPGLWVSVEIDGDGPVRTSCPHAGDLVVEPGLDPGASQWAIGSGTRDVEHTVRISVTDAEGNPVSADGNAVGIGVYHQAAPRLAIAGTEVETSVEYAGRTWVLQTRTGGDVNDLGEIGGGGTNDYGTDLDPSDDDVLIGYVVRGRMTQVHWSGDLGRGESDSVDAPGIVTSGLAGIALRGDYYRVSITSETPVTQAALLFYRPV